MPDGRPLDKAQRALGDMPTAELRRAAGRAVEQVVTYLDSLESRPVVPKIEPGTVFAALPGEPPDEPEPIDEILADYARLIEPNVTHWQHPSFLAYFSSVASGPGIIAEILAAGLNSNVMFWRNAPASTELEQLVVGWLRDMYGLPSNLDGMLTDTASISSLLSIVAARHAVPGLDAREEGLLGRPGIGPLRLYCSEEAHSSIEKGAIAAGVGRRNVVRIPVDSQFRLRPDSLAEAIAVDRREGRTPFCVVATLGTTSSTSVDPCEEIAEIADRERLWLHVDAAYAGTAAVVPHMREHFRGWERADSIIVNPHKWMFTPFDASLLLFRDAARFRDAFSIIPEYLKTGIEGVRNYNELGVQLGRRFRALKLWMIVRYFGVSGIRRRIEEHCRLARDFAGWIDGSPDWERLAPAPFSTVCFRHVPRPGGGSPRAAEIDRLNESILERVNADGGAYLSHTRLAGKYALRVSVGNPRTSEEHVARCWELLQRTAESTNA